MLFHFQFRGPAGWEPIGAGVGDGEDPLAEALGEVRRFAGGTLPAGSYQVIEARSSDTRWQAFELGKDGEIISDPESPSLEEGVCPCADGGEASAELCPG